MLPEELIADAKKRVKYTAPLSDRVHVHDDFIWIAFEWLDAQRTLQRGGAPRDWQGLIADWSGRPVLQADIDVAAELHPRIVGAYPNFNISRNLVRPSNARLRKLTGSGTHSVNTDRMLGIYVHAEPSWRK